MIDQQLYAAFGFTQSGIIINCVYCRHIVHHRWRNLHRAVCYRTTWSRFVAQ